MDAKTRFLRKLITDRCANYDRVWNGKPNFCTPSDTGCKFFTEYETLPRCRYLEEAILPDGELQREQAMYKAILHTGEAGRAVISLLFACEKCGEKYQPSSNRQKVCERCRRTYQREQARKRKAKQRGECPALGV